MKINKVLIANRGEIACRIIRTARQQKITSVAIYTAADEGALHTRLADECYFVENYLNINEIILLAKKIHADAIHPGYGFLSENYLLAKKLEATKIKFIAPPWTAIKLMGKKNLAKQLAKKIDVPTIAGYDGKQQGEKFLQAQAHKIGYPILIKATAGGGGKGMRLVLRAKDFQQALTAAKREAKNSFADENIILEKYIEKPKHIEVQIFADQFGNVVHMFERDCTVQRKYQKLIEETPANINEKIRTEICNTACKIARAVNYEGAGTVEFIFDRKTKKFYFLEMNTRLQVEHRISEQLTGIDLVAWQFEVAAGKQLPKQQHEIVANGHSIEARICAENPANNFAPSSGEILQLTAPQQTSTTIFDSGYESGDKIPSNYDSLIAKWIVHGKTRDEAIKKLQQVLAGTFVFGIETNISFLLAILASKKFYNGNFAENNFNSLLAENTIDDSIVLAGIAELIDIDSIDSTNTTSTNNSAWRYDCFQLFGTRIIDFQCQINGQPKTFRLRGLRGLNGKIEVDLNKKWQPIKSTGEEIFRQNENKICIGKNGTITTFEKINFTTSESAADVSGNITAPMHGQIINVACKVGDKVNRGDLLFSLEAMKMEHAIFAKTAGTISQVKIKIGQQVNANNLVIKIK